MTVDATYTAFEGHQRLAAGSLSDVAIAVKRAARRGATGALLVFDDRTGRVTDVDIRGTNAEIVARHAPVSAAADANDDHAVDDTRHDTRADVGSAEPRPRGRPRLGVVAREVTLLPRHWEWLKSQPGGASVALRKLVDEARRATVARDRARRTQEAAYWFLNVIAGDLPGFEEVSRALFAGDRAGFEMLMRSWPTDVAAHALQLAFPAAERLSAG